MIKKIIKNKLFLFLIFIIIILLIIKISSLNQKQPLSTKNFSIPTTIPPNPTQDNLHNQINNSNPTPKITEINYQIPLYHLLPYKGKYFQSLRYFKANNLEIKVFKKENTDLAKKEVQEWLIKNGVENIDEFTIIY